MEVVFGVGFVLNKDYLVCQFYIQFVILYNVFFLFLENPLMEVGRISLAPGGRGRLPPGVMTVELGYKKRTLFQLGGHPSHSWFHARLCTNFSPCTYIQDDDDGGEDEHEFIFCRGFFSKPTHERFVVFVPARDSRQPSISNHEMCSLEREL